MAPNVDSDVEPSMALGQLDLQARRGPPGLGEHVGDVGDDAGLADLSSGEVHRQQQRVVVAAHGPGLRLTARLREHPPAQRHDVPGLLGDRDETVGADPLPGRQVPADQRLDADGHAVGQPDQRLVLEGELARGQRVGHAGGEREPADRPPVQPRLELGHAAAAVPFRPVQRGVGGLQERPRVRQAEAVAGHDADGGRHHDAVAAEFERLRDGRQHPTRERAQRHLVDVDGEHDELVAARAGHEVPFRAEVVAEPVRDGAQQLVADVVAEGVVDAAEAVDVDGADPDRAAAGLVEGEL